MYVLPSAEASHATARSGIGSVVPGTYCTSASNIFETIVSEAVSVTSMMSQSDISALMLLKAPPVLAAKSTVLSSLPRY
ncbi:MAG: hypothetical protein ACXQTP_04785 [Candidatus Methanofastidiosia archaeon]